MYKEDLGLLLAGIADIAVLGWGISQKKRWWLILLLMIVASASAYQIGHALGIEKPKDENANNNQSSSSME